MNGESGKALSLLAPAKINLNLAVTGRRADGYHTLYSVMHTVGLFDEITLYTDCSQPGGIAIDCPGIPPAENLAFRAAALFAEKLGERLPFSLRIKITKHIPASAGLGGGSSDAACILRALNEQCGPAFSADTLSRMGSSLGCDIPFFLAAADHPCVLAQGAGEQLTPLPTVKDVWAVLVLAGEKQSTKSMYEALDRAGRFSQEDDALARALEKGDLTAICAHLQNDFAQLYRSSAFEQAFSSLLHCGAAGVSLSGSGPSLFGLFPQKAAAIQAAARLSEQVPFACAVPLL